MTEPWFDPDLAAEERDEGIDRAEGGLSLSNAYLMMKAKDYARWYAQANGECCADVVARYFRDVHHIDLAARLGNAMGSLFKGEEWEWTGRVVNSSRARRHSGIQRTWRLT